MTSFLLFDIIKVSATKYEEEICMEKELVYHRKTVFQLSFVIVCLFFLSVFYNGVSAKTYNHSYKTETHFYAKPSEISSISIKGNMLVIKGKVHKNNECNREKTLKGTHKLKLNKSTEYYYCKRTCIYGVEKRSGKDLSKSKFKSYLKKFRKGKKGYSYLYIEYFYGKIKQVTITNEFESVYWHSF